MPLLVSSSLMIAIPPPANGVPYNLRRAVFGFCYSSENAPHQVDQFLGIYWFTQTSVHVVCKRLPQFGMKRATGYSYDLQCGTLLLHVSEHPIAHKRTVEVQNDNSQLVV